MEIESQPSSWEDYVDCRNRPAIKGRHGGMMAASFVLAVEILENLAYLANASNLLSSLLFLVDFYLMLSSPPLSFTS
ncbi:hypothetical protein Leryth_020444 [Lithospermum erythrorhizon]|nr:hypothetical protein Leryth_020444 [Lithospermum erythrorhizon]